MVKTLIEMAQAVFALVLVIATIVAIVTMGALIGIGAVWLVIHFFRWLFG